MQYWQQQPEQAQLQLSGKWTLIMETLTLGPNRVKLSLRWKLADSPRTSVSTWWKQMHQPFVNTSRLAKEKLKSMYWFLSCKHANTKNGFLKFCCFDFNLVYDFVYVFYFWLGTWFGICLEHATDTKMAQKTYSDWKFLISFSYSGLCMIWTKRYTTHYEAFLKLWYVWYQRLWEMTIFDW